MYSFHAIEAVIREYAAVLPLDIFAATGSFLEEIIPPIPAPLIMTTAGSLALEQHHTMLFVLWIAVAGSFGKTFASWIFYILGEKFEHIVIGKWGKFIGVSSEDIENLGKKFDGNWNDDIGLFLFRTVPVFPSVSVSIMCGIIRLNMRTFIGATFFGTIVKNLMYLYVGYGGLQAVHFFVRRIHHTQFWIGVVFVVVSIGLIYFLVHKKRIRSKKKSESK